MARQACILTVIKRPTKLGARSGTQDAKVLCPRGNRLAVTKALADWLIYVFD
jgi:hypothetical protein